VGGRGHRPCPSRPVCEGGEVNAGGGEQTTEPSVASVQQLPNTNQPTVLWGGDVVLHRFHHVQNTDVLNHVHRGVQRPWWVGLSGTVSQMSGCPQRLSTNQQCRVTRVEHWGGEVIQPPVGNTTTNVGSFATIGRRQPGVTRRRPVGKPPWVGSLKPTTGTIRNIFRRIRQRWSSATPRSGK